MLSSVVFSMLNDQLNHERFNHATYRAFSASLDAASWPGAAHWFARQAAEEDSHVDLVMNYIIDQNAFPLFDAMPAPNIPSGLAAFFQEALVIEQITTARLKELYYLDEAGQDPQTCFFAQQLLNEQIEEERAVTEILQRISNASNDTGALFILDQELLKRD